MLEKLKKYLQTAQLASDTNLWDRISILWAESELHGILSTEQVEEVLAELLSKQLPDGGWSMNTLGNWQKQGSRAVSAADASDGYATAYLMYVLKRLQQSEVLPSLLSLSFSRAEQRGLQWLLTHQNASGEWSSASLNRDLDRNHTFVEDAATGFGLAVLHPTR